jgi:SP family facilitated glucose transporter-like MFS transporter 8
MQGAFSLDMGRFFTGYGIGIFSYAVNRFHLRIVLIFYDDINFKMFTPFSNVDRQVPIFIAEIAPKNLRGGLTTLNQVGQM